MTANTRVAVVTGAAAGIGRATASQLASTGTRLVLVDLDGDALARATRELRADGAEVIFIEGSVTEPDLAERAVAAAVDAHGHLDHLVNCAGVLDGYARLEETSLAFLRRVVEINVFGSFNLCRAAVPVMVDEGYGKVVNMASIASFIGDSGGVGYTVSKHALIGLTRHLAATHGPHGIRTNVVCPGVIPTNLRDNSSRQLAGYSVEMHRGIGALTDEDFQKLIPLGHAGDVTDVAASVAYLLSAAGDYVNGASLVVDGGLLTRRR